MEDTEYELNLEEKEVLKKMTNVSDLNWAWEYYDTPNFDWLQFDCQHCMVIEFNWQIYLIRPTEKNRYVKMSIGQVDLKEQSLMFEIEGAHLEEIKIRRNQENVKIRPN